MKYFLFSLLVLATLSFALAKNQCGENEIFNDCGSPCDRTCENPNPMCIQMCKARCECKQGFVVDSNTKKCIDLKKCPKSA
ncbi:TIL domain-containing protein [Caenorhabditis elegans]|uniref:TIL domain-containing protein n=1 Tax=Caenorhabditis elegans TaxID=6239 RepID=Q0G820_CAEEL|nr:TIL domain-containing protein [Caenorhabditis elegans]CAL36507.1 TIL domain-containing protein [Caenorhabditis elegans]|eukprot:NP_001076745.1 Uncharacterized protein CELE_F53C11.9 [Caenorhabditis elegans]